MEKLEKAKEMFSKDLYATALSGIIIDEVGENFAKCSMPLGENHRNAYGAVMGGAIYTLADFAFAVVSNFDKNTATVSLTGQINFISSSKGNTLFAEAKLLKDGRKNCFYEVTVTDNNNKTIAVVFFTGAHIEK